MTAETRSNTTCIEIPLANPSLREIKIEKPANESPRAITARTGRINISQVSASITAITTSIAVAAPKTKARNADLIIFFKWNSWVKGRTEHANLSLLQIQGCLRWVTTG
jgi:hypothetical protein